VATPFVRSQLTPLGAIAAGTDAATRERAGRGLIRVRTATCNQNDEPVPVFDGNLSVPRRPPAP